MNTMPIRDSESFESCFFSSQIILTDGAIGVRLRSEFGIEPDEHIANAGPLYDAEHAAVFPFNF